MKLTRDKPKHRPLCDQQWSTEQHEAACRRYAVVEVDGKCYCDTHAADAPITDR